MPSSSVQSSRAASSSRGTSRAATPKHTHQTSDGGEDAQSPDKARLNAATASPKREEQPVVTVATAASSSSASRSTSSRHSSASRRSSRSRSSSRRSSRSSRSPSRSSSRFSGTDRSDRHQNEEEAAPTLSSKDDTAAKRTSMARAPPAPLAVTTSSLSPAPSPHSLASPLSPTSGKQSKAPSNGRLTQSIPQQRGASSATDLSEEPMESETTVVVAQKGTPMMPTTSTTTKKGNANVTPRGVKGKAAGGDEEVQQHTRTVFEEGPDGEIVETIITEIITTTTTITDEDGNIISEDAVVDTNVTTTVTGGGGGARAPPTKGAVAAGGQPARSAAAPPPHPAKGPTANRGGPAARAQPPAAKKAPAPASPPVPPRGPKQPSGGGANKAPSNPTKNSPNAGLDVGALVMPNLMSTSAPTSPTNPSSNNSPEGPTQRRDTQAGAPVGGPPEGGGEEAPDLSMSKKPSLEPLSAAFSSSDEEGAEGKGRGRGRGRGRVAAAAGRDGGNSAVPVLRFSPRGKPSPSAAPNGPTNQRTPRVNITDPPHSQQPPYSRSPQSQAQAASGVPRRGSSNGPQTARAPSSNASGMKIPQYRTGPYTARSRYEGLNGGARRRGPSSGGGSNSYDPNGYRYVPPEGKSSGYGAMGPPPAASIRTRSRSADLSPAAPPSYNAVGHYGRGYYMRRRRGSGATTDGGGRGGGRSTSAVSASYSNDEGDRSNASNSPSRHYSSSVHNGSTSSAAVSVARRRRARQRTARSVAQIQQHADAANGSRQHLLVRLRRLERAEATARNDLVGRRQRREFIAMMRWRDVSLAYAKQVGLGVISRAALSAPPALDIWGGAHEGGGTLSGAATAADVVGYGPRYASPPTPRATSLGAGGQGHGAGQQYTGIRRFQQPMRGSPREVSQKQAVLQQRSPTLAALQQQQQRADGDTSTTAFNPMYASRSGAYTPSASMAGAGGDSSHYGAAAMLSGGHTPTLKSKTAKGKPSPLSRRRRVGGTGGAATNANAADAFVAAVGAAAVAGRRDSIATEIDEKERELIAQKEAAAVLQRAIEALAATERREREGWERRELGALRALIIADFAAVDNPEWRLRRASRRKVSGDADSPLSGGADRDGKKTNGEDEATATASSEGPQMRTVADRLLAIAAHEAHMYAAGKEIASAAPPPTAREEGASAGVDAEAVRRAEAAKSAPPLPPPRDRPSADASESYASGDVHLHPRLSIVTAAPSSSHDDVAVMASLAGVGTAGHLPRVSVISGADQSSPPSEVPEDNSGEKKEEQLGERAPSFTSDAFVSTPLSPHAPVAPNAAANGADSHRKPAPNAASRGGRGRLVPVLPQRRGMGGRSPNGASTSLSVSSSRNPASPSLAGGDGRVSPAAVARGRGRGLHSSKPIAPTTSSRSTSLSDRGGAGAGRGRGAHLRPVTDTSVGNGGLSSASGNAEFWSALGASTSAGAPPTAADAAAPPSPASPKLSVIRRPNAKPSAPAVSSPKKAAQAHKAPPIVPRPPSEQQSSPPRPSSKPPVSVGVVAAASGRSSRSSSNRGRSRSSSSSRSNSRSPSVSNSYRSSRAPSYSSYVSTSIVAASQPPQPKPTTPTAAASVHPSHNASNSADGLRPQSSPPRPPTEPAKPPLRPSAAASDDMPIEEEAASAIVDEEVATTVYSSKGPARHPTSGKALADEEYYTAVPRTTSKRGKFHFSPPPKK